MAMTSRKGVLANWLVALRTMAQSAMRARRRLWLAPCDAASSKILSSPLPSSSSISVRASSLAVTATTDWAAAVLAPEGPEGSERGGW